MKTFNWLVLFCTDDTRKTNLVHIDPLLLHDIEIRLIQMFSKSGYLSNVTTWSKIET